MKAMRLLVFFFFGIQLWHFSSTSFDIPEPFRWDESFKVFYHELDEEHKRLFDAICNLAKNPGSATLMQTLYHTCIEHFGTEEKMMKAKDYADYKKQKPIHDMFLIYLRAMTLPLGTNKIIWAKEWLVNHIKGIDFKYKGKL